ncbi:MAG: DUF192 domain-containing protein [Rhodospirillaceae bacterium]
MTLVQTAMRRLAVMLGLGVALALVLPISTAPAQGSGRQPLVIHTDGGPHTFAVEFAETPDARAKGLMNRDYLDPRHGMLFDFKKSQRVSMWMRNTYIPLDMLFVDQAGIIVHIEHQAKPLSTTPRGPARPVLGVVELAGGTARALGIVPGNTVDHPMFAGGMGKRR